MKPRVLFVSRRVELPLSDSVARKWDAIGAEIDFRVLAGGNGRDERFHLARPLPAFDWARVLRSAPAADRAGAAFLPSARRARAGCARDERGARGAPPRTRRDGGDRRRARRLARTDAAVRLPRPLDAEPGGGQGRARRASQRRRDPHGHGLHDEARPRAGVGARGRVPCVHGLRLVPAATAAAAAERPQALFVGVLERYKNVDGLAGGVASCGAASAGCKSAHRRQRTLRPVVELRCATCRSRRVGRRG